MFNSVLDKLFTWLSQYFIISTFMPVLLFAGLHAWVLYRVTDAGQALISGFIQQADPFQATFLGAAILIAIALTAYVLSALKGTLREVLEGRYLGGSLTARLTERQHARYWAIQNALDDAQSQRGNLESRSQNWKAVVRDASDLVPKNETVQPSPWSGSLETKVQELEDRWRSGLPLDYEQVRAAVGALALELAVNRRSGDIDRLFRIIDYAIEKQRQEHTKYQTLLEFNYPAGPLEPTKMGNIAATMRSYAETRYDIDLDTFWSRMQKTLADQEEYYATLQDSKAQLDFLVLITWLMGSFTGVWLVILGFYGAEIILLPTIGLLGPLLTWAAYTLACVSYKAFAAQVRGAIDLYRFEFLDSLQMMRPADLTEERQQWVRLGKWLKFGERLPISFKTPK